MRAKPSLSCAADLLSVAGVPVAEATKVLAREPTSPVTQAIKLWGDDEEPFKNLITSSASAAREWRKTMARIIAHLESDDSGRPVFRGWYFGSSAQRAEFMGPILKQGFFVNPRIGMSASRSRRVSTSAAFLNRHGVIWEIRAPRTARDFAAIFDAIGAKYPKQREVVFPWNSRFVLIEAPRKLTLLRSGQKLRVPYLFSKKPEMPTDLQKLARAVAQIKKSSPAHGKRYSTVVENPFESGYWPPTKPTKRDFAVTLRLRKRHATAVAASR